MNKFMVIVVAALTLLAFIGAVTDVSQTLTMQAGRFFTVAQIAGVILMLVHGTFMSTIYFKVALGLVGVIILGALMKIMHLPGANEVLIIPFAFLFITYLIFFLRKSPKTTLDFLKALLAAFILVPDTLWLLHLISPEVSQVIRTVREYIFLVTFLVFAVTQRQKLFVS